jgi:Mrp family chromosome partitioning ATPase
MLSSEKMVAFIQQLKAKYQDHYTILDTTPILSTAETGVLARMVDCILLVIQAGKSSRDSVKRAVKEIAKDKIIGVVFNNTQSKPGYYSKGYYGRS